MIRNIRPAAVLIHLDEASRLLQDLSARNLEKIMRGDIPDDPEEAAIVIRSASDIQVALGMTRSALDHAARCAVPGIDCDTVLTDDELAGPPLEDAVQEDGRG